MNNKKYIYINFRRYEKKQLTQSLAKFYSENRRYWNYFVRKGKVNMK